VSFTHPHDPYVARRRFWDLYADCDHLRPRTAALPHDEQDPHSQRLLNACDWRGFDIRDADITRARRGYFANISYIDDKIGQILQVLEETRQEAVVIFTSDHGDMLGERGLWFKMSFREGAARVPLMIAAPGLPAGRIDAPVSTLDVTPTLAALAGVPLDDIAPWTDGCDLGPLARGTPREAPVAMEYAAEGSVAPMVCLRRGRWKYIRCAADPEQLFDLDTDPDEAVNLATGPAHAETLMALRAESDRRWDLARFDADVRASQARRRVVYEALRQGGHYPWDYQPLQRASERYMRNHMNLNTLEEAQRFPRGE
ncbi:choline-sulfatase, partial [Pontibaca methylaminivorans]|uniref:choline-sulfatase n=1 Tax=Pontibaca methylaminivorans TaxID=515897 RepID=UPI002FD93D08